ncbi:hypothetical protein [Anaeromyxobacter terrae]|uniref:hypothetical protein n=1 Tax=Anaeromyxobacter terrae TaxID=2925406 RepID=UPI001F5774E9|nr:hypothetical protein [Anaeromyxobacter sp. SG22]
MRPVHPALLVLVALVPSLALARPWQGIQPGVSTQRDVVERLGEPVTRAKRGARTVLAYHGEHAPAGTRQAQFHVDPAGVVQEITIFVTAQLDAETVEGTYGKPPQRTFLEDTFQKVWLYPAAGVTVYFGKDGNVEALTFSQGKPARAPAASPAAGASAAAPRSTGAAEGATQAAR